MQFPMPPRRGFISPAFSPAISGLAQSAGFFLMIMAISGCGAFPSPGHPPLSRRKEIVMPAAEPEISDADFRVYSGDGALIPFADAIAKARCANAVFLGEEHGNAVCHYLEWRILTALAQTSGRPAALSLEMFEWDAQSVLTEYLNGWITERHFLRASIPWPGYRENWRPLVEFAKERGMPVIAANAPGRYVNRVARLGAESLDVLGPEALRLLPPLPVPPASEALRKKMNAFLQRMGGHHPGGPASSASGTPPGPDAVRKNQEKQRIRAERMLAAQSLRDAAMAYALARWLGASPDGRILHINGHFHSSEGLGVPERLSAYRPGIDICLIRMADMDEAAEGSREEIKRGAKAAFPEMLPEKLRHTGDIVILTRPPAPEDEI